MIPRCFKAIYLLSQSSRSVSKYSLSRDVPCDQRTAQRILMHLHVENHVRICDWIQSRGQYVPVYSKADGQPDAQKIPVTTADRAEYQRSRRRNRPELKEKEAAVKRNNRLLEHKQSYGMFGI